MVRIKCRNVCSFMSKLLNVLLARDPNHPHNDAAVSLFICIVALTGLTSFIMVLSAIGRTWAEPVLMLTIAMYAIVHVAYDVTNTLSYRSKVREERQLQREDAFKEENASPLLRQRPWRLGEYVGAGFISLMLLILVLVGLNAPLPFGWGRFHVTPPGVEIAANLTLFLLAAFSLTKLAAVPERPRTPRNRMLLILSFQASVAIWFLLGIAAITGNETSLEEAFWVYLAALGVYVSHNMVHSGVLKRIYGIEAARKSQQRPGHWVGIVTILWCGTIILGYAVGLFPYLPLEVLPVAGITAIIFAVSVGLLQFFEDPVSRWFIYWSRKKKDDS